MRDILEGGDFHRTPTMSVTRPVRCCTERSRGRRRHYRPATRRRPAPPVIAVQPGQLVSPHMKFGFPSLLMH